MAYSLMHENPQYEASVDVVVYYNHKTKRFLVGSTEKGVGGYYVDRNEMVGDMFKYQDQIIQEILPELPEDSDHLVLFTNLARNAIVIISTDNKLR